jgi:hypothetical protein
MAKQTDDVKRKRAQGEMLKQGMIYIFLSICFHDFG